MAGGCSVMGLKVAGCWLVVAGRWLEFAGL
jgi:hypothetical protein